MATYTKDSLLGLVAYPTGVAPQKPEQVITPDDFAALILRGQVLLSKKYNGNRAHVLVGPERTARIFSRNGTLEWTASLPATVAAINQLQLPPSTMLDAELYVPSQETVEAVQEIVNSGSPAKGALAEARLQPKLAVFDVLVFEGRALFAQPLQERWALVHQLAQGDVLHPVAEIKGITTYQQALDYVAEHGIEGLVAADLTAGHNVNFNGNTKRGESWKIKIRVNEDLVATKYEPCADPRLGVGALYLSRRNPQGQLTPAGKVGSFEVSFDRLAAVQAHYPLVVEVNHFGVDDRGNMEFPKILRARPDLHPDFGLARPDAPEL